MAQKYIEQAPGGEETNPDGTEMLPITDGVTDYYIQIANLIVEKLRSGATVLDIGSISDGKVLKRSGSEVVSGETTTVQESSGPTILSIGSISDGQFVKRSGSSLIGANEFAYPLYKITPSVSSNNLTVAIKYVDDTDPSSTNDIPFRVGNTEYSLTAATSFTKNAGTNWCNAGRAELAAQAIDWFVYAIGETGASAGLKFGFSRIPYATTMSDFTNTSTNEKYIAGNWTNFNATDAVVVIGRFRAQLSAAASYNWSIATAKVINYPIYQTDWLSWTPQWSNLDTGLVTQVNKYKINYDQFVVKGEILLTGAAISGAVAADPPLVYVANGSNAMPLGLCNLVDTGTTTFYGSVDANATGGFRIRRIDASGTNASLASINATTPHTWANTDEIDYNLPNLPLR